jgi:YD repeat-containing protein
MIILAAELNFYIAMVFHGNFIKKRINKLIIIQCLSILYVCRIFGQNVSNPDRSSGAYFFPVSSPSFNTSRDFIPASPRVASLGIFGQIPIGNFTGTAQINIPIYEIKYKELSVPLSISYHASGNKPDGFPGPVGLGWSMQAGGVISRRINGLSDTEMGYDDDVGEVLVMNLRDDSSWENLSSFSSNLEQMRLRFENDPNPDEYTFNINGQTGKFYMNHKDTFQIQSAQGEYFLVIKHERTNLAVTFPTLDYMPPNLPSEPPFEEREKRPQFFEQVVNIYGNSPYSNIFSSYTNTIIKRKLIGGFTLIDGKGIKYIFGAADGSNKSDKSIEFSRLAFNTDIPIITTISEYVQPISWLLTAIESPMGYKIEFIYEQESYVTKTRFSDLALYRLKFGTSTHMALGGASTEDGARATFINGCYLREIRFPLGKISFSNSEAWQQLSYTPTSYNSSTNYVNFQLYPDIRFANTERICNIYDSDCEAVSKRFFPHKIDMITVMDSSNAILRKINFGYTSSTTSRLKLLTLNINGPNSEVQKYLFEYDDLTLPKYLAGKTDHYGFYNGKEIFSPNAANITSLIVNNPNYIHEKKTPDGQFAQAEILKKIIYPTKGYTIFDYEPHNYSKWCSSWPFVVNDNTNGNQVTGGVRIKAVRNYDATNMLLTEKVYHYERDYLTGGSRSSGVLAYIPQYIESYSGKKIIYHNSIAENLDYFYRFSTTSLYNVMGTQENHISYSEVTEEDPNSGFTVYKYKNHDNGYKDKEPLFYYSNKLADASGSNMVKFWEADEGISMALERGQLLSVTSFDKDKMLKKKITYLYNDNPDRFNEHVRYLKVSTNSIRFTTYRSQRITAGVIYTYFPYLKEKTEVNYFDSDSIMQKETYTYDEKYRLKKSIKILDSQNQEHVTTLFYTADQDFNAQIIKQMAEKQMWAYPFQQTIKWPNNKTESNIFTYKNDLSSLSIPLHYQKIKKYDDNTELLDTEISHYDSYGNPNNIYERTLGNTCVFWGYKGQYPVATIENATCDEVVTQIQGGQNTVNSIVSSGTLNSDMALKLNELRTKLPQARVSTYVYHPLIGILLQTDPNGITTYYEYDDFGRLKTVRDHEGNVLKQYEYHYHQNE